MATLYSMYTTEFATPLDARIQDDNSEVDQYLTCSEQDSIPSEDSSRDRLSEKAWKAIGGRSKRTRRTILKAKRRIFNKADPDEDKPKDEKPFVLVPEEVADPHCGRIDGFRSIDKTWKDPMVHVQQWIDRHQEEFKRHRKDSKPTAMVPPSTVAQPAQPVQQQQQVPLQPTHQLIWMTTLIPVDTTVYPPTYYQRMCPLLVPIGSVNSAAVQPQPGNQLAGVTSTMWAIGSNCQPVPVPAASTETAKQMQWPSQAGFVQYSNFN